MYTVKNNNEYELEIKKSIFISKIYKVSTIEEINNILVALKSEYHDATHVCYAYIIDNIKKSSDDGEPGGTAGIPILQVLEKSNLNYVLCAVIRYFGGIKLGAGGLVRAYTKTTSELIKSTKIIKLIPGYKISLTISYEEQRQLDHILKDIQNEKTYNNEVTYLIYMPKDNISILQNYNYKIIVDTFIEIR